MLLVAGAGTCARCGQSVVPITTAVALATPEVDELRCANGFHFLPDGDRVCKCGELSKPIPRGWHHASEDY